MTPNQNQPQTPDTTTTSGSGSGSASGNLPDVDMDEELRERREETWELLYIKDVDYGDVVDRLSNEYGVTRAAIKSDIRRMDNWLPKLSVATNSAHSRLRELERNQTRRRELLRDLRAEKDKPEEESDYDRDEELRLLNQLDQAATLYVDVAQSVGAIDREPQEHVTKHEGTVNHELSDQQREHLSQLREQSRENIPERDADLVQVEGEEVEREGEGEDDERV